MKFFNKARKTQRKGQLSRSGILWRGEPGKYHRKPAKTDAGDG